MAEPLTRNMPPLTMRAAFAPATIDAERRTVQLIWTTGARVLRGYFDSFWEELSLDPKHVRMERLQSGAPLLDTHRAGGIADVLGVVELAQLERGRGTATVRFDTGPEGEDAFRKVRDGIVRNVSVGYRIHKMEKVSDGEDETPVYRAIDWEPYELTLTPIGADAGAVVRSESTTTNPCEFLEERTMAKEKLTPTPTDPTDPMTGERERSAGITRVGRALKRPDAEVADAIRTGTSLADYRARAQDAHADAELIAFPSVEEMARSGTGDAGRSNPIALMSEALASRFGGPAPSEPARQYVRLSTVDFARHLLEARGTSTRMMSKNQIIERSLTGMHTTSDFPVLLTSAGTRILRATYENYKGGLLQIAKQGNAPDFRPITKLQIGEAGALEKVNEGGEYKRSTMTEGKESYSLATFGRIFALSRQALVNDDLGAFGEMATRLGRSSYEFVANHLATLLTTNPALGDGVAVFHASHGNLAAPGTAISVASLGLALKSMRLQKGFDGLTAIDVIPKYLIVPAALETVALQTVAAITPALVSSVNPFAGKLEVIVDPRLDAFSATAWYLAADPSLIDTIEYAYLDGATGPEVMVREGFNIDGMEWKVRLDFGAGVIDFRGLYKNPGA